jgi:hypothetical protein
MEIIQTIFIYITFGIVITFVWVLISTVVSYFLGLTNKMLGNNFVTPSSWALLLWPLGLIVLFKNFIKITWGMITELLEHAYEKGED